MLEDAVVMARLTRAHQKLAYMVEVGTLGRRRPKSISNRSSRSSRSGGR
jgi:hypothetical protein